MKNLFEQKIKLQRASDTDGEADIYTYEPIIYNGPKEYYVLADICNTKQGVELTLERHNGDPIVVDAEKFLKVLEEAIELSKTEVCP